MVDGLGTPKPSQVVTYTDHTSDDSWDMKTPASKMLRSLSTHPHNRLTTFTTYNWMCSSNWELTTVSKGYTAATLWGTMDMSYQRHIQVYQVKPTKKRCLPSRAVAQATTPGPRSTWKPALQQWRRCCARPRLGFIMDTWVRPLDSCGYLG